MKEIKKNQGDLKPSAFDEWWSEIQEWRGKRQKKRQENYQDAGYWHRKNTAARNKRSTRLWWGKALIGVLGGFILTIVSVLASFFATLFRFSIWIIIAAVLFWGFDQFTTSDTSDKTDATDGIAIIQNVIKEFEDTIDKLKNEFSISILTKDGTVIEWGNESEKPTPIDNK